jgi:hypothetical protein
MMDYGDAMPGDFLKFLPSSACSTTEEDQGAATNANLNERY